MAESPRVNNKEVAGAPVVVPVAFDEDDDVLPEPELAVDDLVVECVEVGPENDEEVVLVVAVFDEEFWVVGVEEVDGGGWDLPVI